MAVIRGAESFKERSSNESSSFRAWLFSIAHRRLAEFWRQQYKHQTTNSEEASEQAIEDHTDESTPEQSRLLQELDRGLNGLPPEQRQCFLLRQEGFSYQEIAGITETNAETVKSRLRYAKNSLQALMQNSPVENHLVEATK